MFTGIVEDIGKVSERKKMAGDLTIVIETDADIKGTKVGDSVSLSGVCLTVVGVDIKRLRFDVSAETLSCTQLGALRDGSLVNLELALRPSGRYGGHFVTGHIDGLGRLCERQKAARSVMMVFECSSAFAPYVAEKGSICVDGVSLTVNDVIDSREHLKFAVNIIPHTIEVTTLGNLGIGERVNIEFDQIARYVERLINWKGSVSQQ